MLAGLEISWLAVAYAAVASFCLTLALMYLLLSARLEGAPSLASLLFGVILVAVAGTGASEFLLSQATTIEAYRRLLRLTHIPIGLFIVMIPWFVRLLFGTGRIWLALAGNGLWIASLAINFLSPYSRLYARITEIERVSVFDGVMFTVVRGVPHPLRWVAQMGTILILVFVADAALALWRRGNRQRAYVIGVTTALALAIATGQSALISTGVLRTPYMISFAFLWLVGGMAFELVDDARRAGVLGQRVLEQAEELREQEEHLRLATDAANLGVWSWRSDEPGIWMTPRTRKLLGLDPTATVTWSCVLDIVHPGDRRQALEEVRRVRQAGGDFKVECRVIRADGALRWIMTSGRMELGINGQEMHATGVALDTTGSRETEAELEMQRATVAHLARVTMLSEVSSSIAHELSQPLTAIQSNAQAALRFLSREPRDLGEVRDGLLEIVAGNRHAREVIERLRRLLKKGQRRSDPLNLNDLVKTVLRLLRGYLGGHEIKVETRLAPELPNVLGDEVLLHQVLLNLVRNASEAMTDMESDGRRLVVRTQVLGEAVQITVTDRGGGIPESDVERIFQPFFTTRPDGTGLGLAVSRTIVRAHGGLIRVSSGDGGRGASVHVLLPMGPEPAA